VAHYRRLRGPIVVPLGHRDGILEIIVGRSEQLVELVTRKQGVLLASLVIHLPDVHFFITVAEPAKPELAAWIGSGGNFFRHIHRRQRVQRRVNSVVYKRGSQSNLPAAVASWRRYRCPIAGEHRRGRNVGEQIAGVRTLDRALVTTEEEEFVFHYRS